MCFGVGGVDELPRHKAVGDFLRQLVRLGDGALHALGAVGQHQFGTVGFHELAALDAHRFGHDDDDAVAARGGDACQTDAGVAGGRLNNDRAGLELARCLGVVDHGLGDAVLDGTGGVEVFQLGKDFCLQVFGLFDMGQFQQRGVADQLVCGCINVAHDAFLQNIVYKECLYCITGRRRSGDIARRELSKRSFAFHTFLVG